MGSVNNFVFKGGFMSNVLTIFNQLRPHTIGMTISLIISNDMFLKVQGYNQLINLAISRKHSDTKYDV